MVTCFAPSTQASLPWPTNSKRATARLKILLAVLGWSVYRLVQYYDEWAVLLADVVLWGLHLHCPVGGTCNVELATAPVSLAPLVSVDMFFFPALFGVLMLRRHRDARPCSLVGAKHVRLGRCPAVLLFPNPDTRVSKREGRACH